MNYQEFSMASNPPSGSVHRKRSKRYKRAACLLGLLALGCFALQPARAELVEYRAQGTVTSVDSNNGLLPLPVSVGDALVFEFSFDTAAIDTNTIVNYQGQYAVISMTVTVGSNAPVAVTNPRISIQSNPSTNKWGVSGCLPSCASATYDEVRLNFFPPSGSILTDALTLPQIPYPPGTFVQFGFFSSENPGGLQDSANATLVSLGPVNDPPTADAGPDLAAAVGQRVQLSGLLSSDPETPALALQYAWTIESAPSGSTAALEDATAAVTGFVPDIPGDYILSLVVRDEGGLASEAAFVSVVAELEPAFTYERLSSGSYSYLWGPTRYDYQSDYFHPYGLSGGDALGQRQRYDYGYDWTSGAYEYSYDNQIARVGDSGETRLVGTGDPMPDLAGGTFREVWYFGREGSAIAFWGWGQNPAGESAYGEYTLSAAGTVSKLPSAPVSVSGEADPLQYLWRGYWGSNFASLVYGSNGKTIPQERTVTYACGVDYTETCSYTYTDYRWHYGLYVLNGTIATRIVDSTVTVPGETVAFVGFGNAAQDVAGNVAFVGYWIDGSGQWRQGLFRKSSSGALEKSIDDRDPKFSGGWFGRIQIDGSRVYFGGASYLGSSYGTANGGQQWWSGYRVGIFSVADGVVNDEAVGGQAWLYRYDPGFYQYSGGYSIPDTWNFAVQRGVLAFNAWSYYYSYDSTSGNYTYSEDSGAYWKEAGRVRPIARSGDQLAGQQYQYAWACCAGDWLEGRTALVAAQNYTYTYDSATSTGSQSGQIDTIRARFDTDRDGRGDDVDNCPARPNPDQADADSNGVGDVCEDTDLDSWPDTLDNCPVRPNNQVDLDLDGFGDACDVCPYVSDDQSDIDGDGVGDACDNDGDNDTVADNVDNCPLAPNTDQANLDGDALGDACDPDLDGDGIANTVDGVWDGVTFTDQSRLASDDFSDHRLGGRSYGRIVNRGQLIILADDASGSDQGLQISAVNGTGSGLVKQCDFKGKAANVRLEQGSVINVTCGSLSVRALARGAQIVLDDDVLIDVQQQAEARVVGLGDGEFRVENTSDTPLPLVVNLEGNVQVTLPAEGAATVSEPTPGGFVVENTPESPLPLVVTVDGRETEVAPGETGEVEQLRDTTPPVITPTVTGTLGSNGWYTSIVQVDWTVADAESAVSSSSGCTATSITSDTGGTTLTCTASSAGGTASQSVTIKRDATAPHISVGAPAEGAVYTINQVVAAAYSCEDSLSGVDSCSGAVSAGSGIDTATVGAKTFTVTATDQAGNVAVMTRDYSVRYSFVGFLQPVDNLPVFNLASAGRTIPVKWQLVDAAAAYIASLSTFRSLASYATNCDSGAPSDVIEEVASTGGTALRYDTATNQFIYSWSTASSWKGKCRRLVLELADGQKKEALFRFK